MNNFALAYRNLVGAPDTLVDAYFGSFVSGDQDTLKDPRLAITATIEGTSAAGLQWLSTDWPRQVQVIGLLGFAATVAGAGATTWRVVGINSGGSPVTVFDTGDVAFTPLPQDGFPRHSYLILSAPAELDEVRILFEGVGTVTLEVGGMWVGPLWSTQRGALLDGWTLGVIDPSKVEASLGGQTYDRQLSRRRSLDAQLGTLSWAEAFGGSGLAPDAQMIAYELGASSYCIAWPRTRRTPDGPLDATVIHRLGIYGRLTQPLSITAVQGDQYRLSPLHVEESG